MVYTVITNQVAGEHASNTLEYTLIYKWEVDYIGNFTERKIVILDGLMDGQNSMNDDLKIFMSWDELSRVITFFKLLCRGKIIFSVVVKVIKSNLVDSGIALFQTIYYMDTLFYWHVAGAFKDDK